MKQSLENFTELPLVSVIITFYNSNSTLADAISSIIFQSYKNWEIVFIDDGSSEDPKTILKKFNELKINHIKLNKNYGRGFAYQKGLDNAKGQFVMFLDSDDWWYSNKIEKQIKYLLANPKIKVLGSGIISADKNVPIRVRGNNKMKNLKLNSLSDPPLAFATVCINSRILHNYQFDQNLSVAQDIDFLQSLLMKEYFSNLSDILYVYNEYDSFKQKKMHQAWINRISGLTKFRKKYPLAFLKQFIFIKVKIYLYNILFKLNLQRFILKARGKKLKEEEKKIYDHQYSKLIETKNKYFF